MENTEKLELLDRLTTTIGQSSSVIVTEYTKYMVANSLSYISFGILICFLAKKYKLKDLEDEIAIIIRGTIFFIGLLFIFLNIADLFSPNAAAIHQLIKDIRGSLWTY